MESWRLARQSLPRQVAQRLRSLAAAGRLPPVLPSEAVLAVRFGTSRRTVRAALAMLEAEGWVSGGQGRRRQVRALRGGRACPSAASRLIGYLTPFVPERSGGAALFQFESFRAALLDHGWRTQVVPTHAERLANPGRALAAAVSTVGAAAWVLHLSSPEMQRWFASRRIPCVVNGTTDRGSGLCGVDADWQAMGRHAAGTLLHHGHTSVALLEPSERTIGLARLNAGLAAGLAGRASLHVLRHDGSVAQILRELGRIRRLVARPTAIVVHAFRNLLTVLTGLATLGVRIPDDFAVLSTDDDPLIDRLVPSIAHYRRDHAAQARRLADVLLRVLDHRPPRQPVILMPDFVPGDSLPPRPGSRTAGR